MMKSTDEKLENGLPQIDKANYPYHSPNFTVNGDSSLTNSPGPDSRRAWLIVFACAWVAFVTVGLSRAEGVIFVAFVNNYNTSREDASWPFSVYFSTFCLSSPLIAPLCTHVSLRLISSVGSIVTALGVGLSYFAEDITSLTLLFGFMQGFGVALLNIPATMLVNLYFERHRTTANGIFLGGICIGAFVFPPVVQAILTSHGLKNSFLCMSTILFSSLLPVMVFVLPEWAQKAKEHKKSVPSDHSKQAIERTNMSPEIHQPSSKKDLKLLNELRASQVSIFDEKESLVESINGYQVVQPHFVSFPQFPSSCENSVQIIHSRKNTMTLIWTVLSHPMFWLVLALLHVIGFCFQIYLQIIVDYSAERGISATTASYVVSVMSILDLVGRLGTGWISDGRFVTKRTLVSSMCAFGGLCFCLIPFIDIVHVFMFLSVCSGFIVGVLTPLVNASMMEYFGQDKFVIVFALSLFISGCLAFTRPVLVGYFRDSVGSYHGLLVCLGVTYFLTAFMWLFEPLITRRVRLAEEKENQTNVSYGSTS